MFYFAYIDATNTCTGVYAMPTDLSAVPGYIAITEEQFTSQSVLGKVWNADTQTWDEPFVFACTTDDVDYKGTRVKLTAKLDEMDEAIEGKADASDLHSHDNKAVLDGITEEKVALWDAGASGSGTPGNDGEDGEDGATFTPSVAADGTLSWTNDKGLDNPAPVNIKGADGEDGQDGQDGVTPHIGANGNWFIGETDTGVSAQGASGAEITAAHILEKLLNVDGQNSGLDADKLDGHDSTYFATATQLNGKADAEHSHTGYAESSHTHTPASIGASPATHTHTPSSIGAAPSSHSHSEYASSNHSHSDYLPTSGGAVNGNLNVAGIFRVNGQQAVYDSGSMVTLSTNNRETMIAGSKIYSKTTISVSSDRRLKENIEDVSAEDMAAIVKGLDIKTFNYIGNDEPCIGVIAQELAESCPAYANYFLRQDENGYFSVKAADLVFPLIATVQKLAKEIEELKK